MKKGNTASKEKRERKSKEKEQRGRVKKKSKENERVEIERAKRKSKEKVHLEEHLKREWTMAQNDQESSCKCWATSSSSCLFAHTAHLFACNALLVLLAHSFARSLTYKLAER